MLSDEHRNRKVFLIITAVVFLAVVGVRGCFFLQKRSVKPARAEKAGQLKKAVRQLKPVASAGGQAVKAGRMAIIIDDWGYNRFHCKYLESIDVPIGVAILPNLPYSRDIIACSQSTGHEPMLHLPLEPHVDKEDYPKGYILTTEMPVATLKKTLDMILKEMPGIVGVNNHMGSKATESMTVMSVVLQEIKRRGLFFVDSFTSERSVCLDAASALKMKIGRRDVFLDNRNERVAIEKQFAQAVRTAKKRGYALVIGHDRALTLQIIKEQTDKLRKEGIEFLSVKDYIKRYEYSRN